jgi:3-hydroxyacyl-[acyl-carrier-protein] dehydratase
MQEILDTIPQRKPFLFIDTIKEYNQNSLRTQLSLSGEEDFFKGHFPEEPVMPGVLLCEACFQTGAALINKINGDNNKKSQGLGVVTRIKDTKFKRIVRPGDILDITVTIEEWIGNACYMKGVVEVDGKKVMTTSFQVATISQ